MVVDGGDNEIEPTDRIRDQSSLMLVVVVMGVCIKYAENSFVDLL